MSEDFWSTLGDVATALAFIVVAWQAFLTRRALLVAQHALTASQSVALDTARTRMDAQAPDVAVRISGVEWPPKAWTSAGMPVGTFPAGHEWHFPIKQEERLVLQAPLRVENSGNRHVAVEYDGDIVRDVDGQPQQPAASHLLWPQQRSLANPSLYLQRAFTLKELSENHEARAAGRPLPHRVTGTVTVHDGRDNGVSDVWHLELTGCPVRPDWYRDGIWFIDTDTGEDSLDFEPYPTAQRIYWVSRRQQQRLPEPTYIP